MGKPRKNQPIAFAEATVSVGELSISGDGIGTVDGRALQIPFTLPGERVRIAHAAECRRGDLLEVLEPSPDRIAPRCPLFGRCGGCQYQHLPYGRQLEWKRRHIAGLFSPLGIDPSAVAPPLPSPKDFFYRTKLTPHHGRIRGGGDDPIGFLEATRRRILDVGHCPIATEAINDALVGFRERVRAKPTRRGGTLLLRQAGGRVVEDPRELLCETVHGRPFHFLAGGFFQNNGAILPDFVDCVLGQILDPAVEFLVDAYCGVGFFALSAAPRLHRVMGIEIDRSAIRLARLNGNVQGVANGEFLLGAAEEIFGAVDFPPDRTAVLLDPPRAGCGASFLDQLLRFGPRRIVYVSCGPESQVRDLRVLLPAYAIRSVAPVDLFPQTRHIENVVALERRCP
jgi:23S rRNA (uracil1939-C5)-methyltransferase/tRNA (uracil-5-)-methyltransferase